MNRLLIVDDERELRNSLLRRYTLKGFEAETAENGNKALEKLEAKPYKVVISDIKMPGMDGVELLRKIRKEYPMTRVIMITGYVTLENGLAAMRHGADTCIFKPFEDLTEMDNAVNAAIEHLDHWDRKLSELSRMNPENKGEI